MTDDTKQDGAQDGAQEGQSASKAMLEAVNAADSSMMKVVNMLIDAGDERWRELSKLQTAFCAPLQVELTASNDGGKRRE